MWLFFFALQTSLRIVESEPSWFIVSPGSEIAFHQEEAAPPEEVPLATPGRPEGQSIVVCLKDQMLRAYDGDMLVYEFPCSTGKNNATPAGEFPIRQKVRHNRALPEYGSVPIPFSLRLDVVVRGRRHLIAIHAHKSVPRRPASHGCIRLSHANAEKLFSWAKVGTNVSILRDAPEPVPITARSNP